MDNVLTRSCIYLNLTELIGEYTPQKSGACQKEANFAQFPVYWLSLSHFSRAEIIFFACSGLEILNFDLGI